MQSRNWIRRITPRRLLGRLRRGCDAILKRNRVVFFRCDPIESSEAIRGQLVEADSSLVEQWQRTEPEFPWPSPDEGPRRFGEGHRLFALVSDARPRCYGWISVMQTFWLDELKQHCGTDGPMTWIWNCVTPASMRNRGHYTEFLRALRRYFRDRDLLIFCHAHNAPSYRAILRAGFQPWTIITQFPGGTGIDVVRPRFGLGLNALPQPQEP